MNRPPERPADGNCPGCDATEDEVCVPECSYVDQWAELGEQSHTCPTRTPEPHGAGEFPMTCHACHIDADS